MDVAGVELFKDLSVRLETSYRELYLTRLSSVWMSLISPDGKSISAWNCSSILKQHDFYKTQIVPYLEAGPNRRAYVIISDALRYEVGDELSAILSGNTRYTVSLSSALTGLPSITRLGMASLLPHGSLTIPSADSVLVDGKNAQGLENRKKIIGAYNGIAIDADSLLAMKRDEARSFQKNASVIYIYHDIIDATGDKAASEDMTFKACRSACVELEQIIRYITNTMNGSHIIVTADHDSSILRTMCRNRSDRHCLSRFRILANQRNDINGERLCRKYRCGLWQLQGFRVWRYRFWFPDSVWNSTFSFCRRREVLSWRRNAPGSHYSCSGC